MRIESSVTSLSWIPQGAVEGFNRLSFGLGVAHYDPPSCPAAPPTSSPTPFDTLQPNRWAEAG